MTAMLHVTHDVTTRPHTDLKKNYRNFFVRTYLNKESVYSLVSLCSKWAFIYHDKDDAEPHYHVLMHFDNGRTVKSISKSLQGLAERQAKDFSMPIQKSHCEVCDEPKTAYKYLTHTDPSSIAKGKTIYSDTEVYSQGVEFFKDGETKDFAVTDMLDAINKGMPFREMASKFGKSFVTQYGRYKEYATLLRDEENPRASTRAIEFTFGEYLNGNCSASVLLRDVIDTIAFDLYGKQYQDAESVAKCKEFEDFIVAVDDIFNERRLFYKGLDKVADLKLYGFDKVDISISRGVTDAVKHERYQGFGCEVAK